MDNLGGCQAFSVTLLQSSDYQCRQFPDAVMMKGEVVEELSVKGE